MKKIDKWIAFSILTLGLASCDFNTKNYQEISIEQSYESVQDVQNGMNGAYNALGDYYFLGNYAIAYGDMCGGVSNGSLSTGHFLAQSSWTISDTDVELEGIWEYGFKVIDGATRTIAGGKSVLNRSEELFLSPADIANVKLYIAQSYALKALANYYLVNLFGLPYHEGVGNLGLPLVKDAPIEPFQKIERATVGATYAQITGDIQLAEDYMTEALTFSSNLAPSAFYMGPMGIQALKARVYMDMGDYDTAEQAALKAIELKGKGNGKGDDELPSDDAYQSMWSSLAITDEDLFTIAKLESDNLSANALNTLYGSYGASLKNEVVALYDENDIRLNLIGNNTGGKTTLKYQGLPTSAATSNIPIFRKSEMSLILAEIYARRDNIPFAQDYLFYTAKRNKALAKTALPSSKDQLLQFISDERIREFAGEGHRFYDARRMGDKLMVKDNPFDIQKFVFPIPAAEINAGFCTQQNEGWSANLPH